MISLIIETLANRTISLDPDAAGCIAQLSGKSVRLVLQGTGQEITFAFTTEGLTLMDNNMAVDTEVTGTPIALSRLILAPDPSRILFEGEVSIVGERDVIHHFKNCLLSMDLDWQEALSHVSGDVIAHQAGRFFSALTKWGKDAGSSLLFDVDEFLREEMPVAASGYEVKHFSSAVADFRDAVARLEKRVARAEKNMQGES